MNSNQGSRSWSCQQLQGIAGLTVLALVSAVLTSELPLTWEIILGAGQLASWVLAVVSAVLCHYTTHNEWEATGTRKICEKCQRSRMADSNHCDLCEVCVPAYSHHSDWLNNCVGACNYCSYMICLLGLGLSALCQFAAGVSLLIISAFDEGTAARINSRYSLRDQGYLFHLLHHFSSLISAVLAFSSFLSLFRNLPKALSAWKQRKESSIFSAKVMVTMQEKCANVSSVSLQMQSNASNVRFGEAAKQDCSQSVVSFSS